MKLVGPASSASSASYPLRRSLVAALLGTAATAVPAVHAQVLSSSAAAPAELAAALSPAPPLANSSPSSSASAADPALPEAPVPQFAIDPKPKVGTPLSAHIARRDTKIIPSDWNAQPLTAKDKLVIGAKDLYSFGNLGAMVLSAGYEQVLNGEPNYGADKGAFGERIGAAALRETTQGAFTDMVFAPLLHEDPRYYVKGPDYDPVRRTLYAITRPLVTRKDNGSHTVNGALLLGYAASAALTPAYYPQNNRAFHDVASVYGGSLGGAALGFFISEFSQDVLRAVHLSSRP